MTGPRTVPESQVGPTVDPRGKPTDYRTLYDAEYVGAWDLTGPDGRPRDVTVTIARVKAGRVVGEGGRSASKPILYFSGSDKGLICNKTNGRVIAGLYGPDVRAWVGRRITLYPTRVRGPAGDEVDAVRVRPTVPREAGGRRAADDGLREDEPAAAAREPGEDDR